MTSEFWSPSFRGHFYDENSWLESEVLLVFSIRYTLDFYKPSRFCRKWDYGNAPNSYLTSYVIKMGGFWKLPDYFPKGLGEKRYLSDLFEVPHEENWMIEPELDRWGSWQFPTFCSFHFYNFVDDHTGTWNPKHPLKNGCLVISNHFLCKDWVHHPIETTIYKWLALGFEVIICLEYIQLKRPFSSSSKAFFEGQRGRQARRTDGVGRSINVVRVEFLMQKAAKKDNPFLGGGFKIFFIFTPTWANDPIWLIFFRWVETTN